MITASEHHASGQTILDHRLTPADAAEYRVAVLSAALLRAVMNTHGEDHEGFADRAGVPAGVVEATVDGTYPAWALPYDEFMALADVVAVLWPCAAFEIAAACDLLLTSVLNGDQFMATDVLTDPASRGLARALLRLAIQGQPGSNGHAAGNVRLSDSQLAQLNERASDLARSASPDAWVGTEILTGCTGRQS